MHLYHALTHVCVGSSMCCGKLHPCLSYSRRRDHIKLVLWHSLHTGGGVGYFLTKLLHILTSSEGGHMSNMHLSMKSGSQFAEIPGLMT